jgi:hypothetical protein
MTKLTLDVEIKAVSTVTLSSGNPTKQISHPAPGIALIRALSSLKKPCLITAIGETNRYLTQRATHQDFARLLGPSGSVLAPATARST